MYLGAFISVKTESFKYQFIFWILYFVTIITVAQIVACIIIFIKYYNKSGEIGPRGFEGKIGDKGDKGKCEKIFGVNKIDCGEGTSQDCDYHIRLIKVMIQKIYEKEYKRNLNDNEIEALYNLDLNLKMEDIKKILGIEDEDDEINHLFQLKYSDLRRLHAHITINASSKQISECLNHN